MSERTLAHALPDLRRWRPHVNLHHRGEPFLHPNIVEMIREMSATGARVTLHTGAHVPLSAPAREILSAGLSELVISLGAANPKRFAELRPGSDRDAVLERTRDLLAAGRKAKTATVVEVLDPKGVRNLRKVPDTLDANAEIATTAALFAETPPDEIRLRPVHNWAGSVGQADGGVRSRCMFPFYAMVVLCDGQVVACPQDFEGRLVVGNLEASTLSEIWRGDALRRLRRRRRADLAAEEPCVECSLLRGRGPLGIPRWRAGAFGRRKVFPR